MTRILVVDDDVQIVRALDINLRAHGYEVVMAATGEAALTSAAAATPDLVIVDLGLPGLDGIDVIRGLRGWTTVPIIVVAPPPTRRRRSDRRDERLRRRFRLATGHAQRNRRAPDADRMVDRRISGP